MNKYELCVVVSAKLEDEARAELVERIKDMIAKQEANAIISSISRLSRPRLLRLRAECESWMACSDIYALDRTRK